MTPVIDVDSLCKHYRRGDERIVALDAVSFRIDAPCVTALAGPSGSGKSTLLGMLARFDQPDSGTIRIDGERLDAIPERDMDRFRNRKLGFVFQQFNLVPALSAQENVELALAPQSLPTGERRRRAAAALDLVGIGQRAAHTPRQLSGGQQQRVAIARALVNGPRFVIADEPTGNLDGKTANELLRLIERLHRDLDTTFLIATHDARVIEMAQRVIALEDGRLAA